MAEDTHQRSKQGKALHRSVTDALQIPVTDRVLSRFRSMSKLITKVPHGAGHTCLAFSKDGKRAFTGGQDCVVLIWRLDEGDDQEPERAPQADDAVTSISATHHCWLSGSTDSVVRRYLRDGNTYEGDLTDMKGIPVRDVAVDPKGKRAVVVSDDVTAKVIDLEDPLRVYELKGHQRGVRRAKWHPSLPLIVTCGSDGKIIAWDVSSNEAKIEATIESVIPVVADIESPEFNHDCSVVWHSFGQQFFVATRTHEIAVISRSTWSKASTIPNREASGPITALALSPNDLYLASATLSGVYVWSTETKRVIASHNGLGAQVTQIAFSPKDNLLAWTDDQGSFNRWPAPIPNDLPSPTKLPNSSGVSSHSSGLELFSDTMNINGGLADEDDFDTNMDDLDDGLDDPNFVIDDLGIGYKDEPELTKHDEHIKEMVSITKAQPPFQPGSTPFLNRKRYLAYNLLGVIEATQQDDHQVINIEFFDRSTRKGFHFTDRFAYDIGYLGERGALFACQTPEEQPHVCFKSFGQWASQKEWTYELRLGTKILGIVLGGLPPSSSLRQNDDGDLQGYGNIVIATSESDLTFLSGSGRERRIMGFGAEFVTMVAGSEWVFVVHREGSTTIDGSQNLSYSIINFDDFSVRQHGILPIPKGHLLTWAGITDQGAPTIYDSAGRLHILTKYRVPHHASWARVMDTNLLERREGKDESYWPLGVTRDTFFCIILKGRQEFPGFPRPLIQELPLQMPFRRNEPKEELFERELLFIQIDYDTLDEELTTDAIVNKERVLDKELIQLIQIACKDPADNPRALELTKLLHNTVSIDAAMKIAEFYHLTSLKEKMQLIKSDREEREDRLVTVRNKRRRWLKPEPAPREIQTANRPQRIDPLAERCPPPTIERPGIARVTMPVIESSQYAKSDAAPPSSLRSAQELPLTPEPFPMQDSKRKRDEEETQADDFLMPPPKQKANPFARRPGQEISKNPFARKTDSNRVIAKSESFFEKIDVGNKDTNKAKRLSVPKAKEKKESRQTTLFGMMKGQSNALSNGQDTETLESESQSQCADVTSSDALTQGTSTSVASENTSDDWEETQIVDDSTQCTDDTQLSES